MIGNKVENDQFEENLSGTTNQLARIPISL